jgi:hypothetical protein
MLVQAFRGFKISIGGGVKIDYIQKNSRFWLPDSRARNHANRAGSSFVCGL